MGILDRLLGKGKSWEEELAREEVGMKSSEEKYAPVDDGDYGRKEPRLPELIAKLDKLEAQVESVKQLRPVFEERFTRLSEEIGELRAVILEQEKNTRALRAEAEKATALVAAVRPEALMKEVRKLEMRIDELKAVSERLDVVQKTITEEMRDLRSKTELLKGGETLVRLNEEVRGQFAQLKKLEALNQNHAEKVENIYLDVQDKFSRYSKLDDRLRDAEKGINEMARDVEKAKVRAEGAAPKKDIDAARADLSQRISQVEDKLGQLAVSHASTATSQELNDLNAKLDAAEKVIVHAQADLMALEDKLAKLDGKRTPAAGGEEQPQGLAGMLAKLVKR